MNTFKKEERLCSKLIIDSLFKSGSSFLLYPFRVQLSAVAEHQFPPEVAVQVLIIVPKKRFKRAVDRNLLKRRMRELYRLHKNALLSKIQYPHQKYALALSYVGNQIHDYPMMEHKYVKLCEKITQKFFQNEVDS